MSDDQPITGRIENLQHNSGANRFEHLSPKNRVTPFSALRSGNKPYARARINTSALVLLLLKKEFAIQRYLHLSEMIYKLASYILPFES